jgi:hypothetical protein
MFTLRLKSEENSSGKRGVFPEEFCFRISDSGNPTARLRHENDNNNNKIDNNVFISHSCLSVAVHTSGYTA